MMALLDMSLCETCWGRGTVSTIEWLVRDKRTLPCPAGCRALKVERSDCVYCEQALRGRPYKEHVSPDEHGLVREDVEYHTPESLLLWCTSHSASLRWPHMPHCYEYRKAHTPCHIVAYEMPTEPLGELA